MYVYLIDIQQVNHNLAVSVAALQVSATSHYHLRDPSIVQEVLILTEEHKQLEVTLYGYLDLQREWKLHLPM